MLAAGDVVEMTVAGVGTLRNRIGPCAAPGYLPEPKRTARPAASDIRAGS
jgi:hypothetical protein